MYTVFKTRTFPTEFSVSSPDSPAIAVFHGPEAESAAREYSAFKNSQIEASKASK